MRSMFSDSSSVRVGQAAAARLVTTGAALYTVVGCGLHLFARNVCPFLRGAAGQTIGDLHKRVVEVVAAFFLRMAARAAEHGESYGSAGAKIHNVACHLKGRHIMAVQCLVLFVQGFAMRFLEFGYQLP